MSDNQQPKPYDAVLGNQNQAPEGAAVLGGIEGVKQRLNNENPQARIAALRQALNYGEPGLDLVIKALEDESPQVQIKAYSLLVPLSEQKVKQALVEFNPDNLRLEAIETVTVNRCGEIIQRKQHLARYFVENLVNGINLEMAYIPGGTFLMGLPEDEKSPFGRDYEKPQHQVTVKPFYMGKFTITQAQWKVIAELPKIERKLKLDPAYFKGDNRPVERVSWYDVIEFCSRLSEATGKKYRLPSEAEWEYACRAGTITPFHYGETITGELANYDASFTYADEPKGEWREQTIPVGQFPPNAFGLYDMHGNVWEWCQDNWHDSYRGAPKDGSSWITQRWNIIFGTPFSRVVRSGSWFSLADWCRSTQRFSHDDESELIPSFTNDRYHIKSKLGFRIACDIF
ncbi:MAG: SUMF1/EgtB/PvdO family nonheme iron enzyme [Cyanobacteriota bacterium]|nr:SUMF1/EgtB/PvdO family nonheme iron enzyme [Cyanobacteriota bacterium]